MAPRGSYNGEIGVPLTVFTAGTDTRYLVIEMGATGIGHISYLADMVKPDIGVVLGVGTAHAGEFGGVDNIALAKGSGIATYGRNLLSTIAGLGMDGQVLRRGHDLAQVLRVLERKLIRPID